jgi:transglutaminase-like putative cysteine protease
VSVLAGSLTSIARWASHRLHGRRVLLVALMALVLGSVAIGLADHLRDVDLSLTLPLAMIGLLVGWGLSFTRVPEWLAAVLTLGAGLMVVGVLVGHLGDELLALPAMLVQLVWAGLRLGWQWVWYGGRLLGVWVDFATSSRDLLFAVETLWTGFSVLLSRVYDWVSRLVGGDPIPDPVAASFCWGAALWAVSVWASWVVHRRQHVLLGLTPAGTLLAASLLYMRGDTASLLVLSGAVLLAMALVVYDTRVRCFEEAGIDIARGLSTDVAVASILVALALVGTATVAQSISIRDIVDYVRKLTAAPATAGRSAGGASRGWDQPHTSLDLLAQAVLPLNHLAIAPAEELSGLVVMTVNTGEMVPVPESAVSAFVIPRYYWRSVTYDRYSGDGWYTSGTWEAAYVSGEASGPPPLEAQRPLRQEVSVAPHRRGIVHVAGTLIAVDHDYTVEWRSPDDAFGATCDAETYRADSVVSEPSIRQLREAGTDYPDWVSKYLDLPDTVTPRTLALARDLTATQPTPYDRAVAIETYLRDNYPYVLDVPFPTSGQDMVDFFLFDLREGYCTYYASAMVVLARASGVPARLVLGYASGTYDPLRAHYVVTEADSHAWPELYFPGYGWVEFEPTAGRPAIVRHEENSEPAWKAPEGQLVPPPDVEASDAAWSRLSGSWCLALPGGIALLASVGAIWQALDYLRLRILSPAVAVTTMYRRLERHGRRLVALDRLGNTPYEFAHTFADWVRGLQGGEWWKESLAPAVPEVYYLTKLYVLASYSARQLEAGDRANAWSVWQRLRWRLWMARLRWRGGGGLRLRWRSTGQVTERCPVDYASRSPRAKP